MPRLSSLNTKSSIEPLFARLSTELLISAFSELFPKFEIPFPSSIVELSIFRLFPEPVLPKFVNWSLKIKVPLERLKVLLSPELWISLLISILLRLSPEAFAIPESSNSAFPPSAIWLVTEEAPFIVYSSFA